MALEKKETNHKLQECKKITTTVHGYLIRAHTHSAGAFINHIYMQMKTSANKMEDV